MRWKAGSVGTDFKHLSSLSRPLGGEPGRHAACFFAAHRNPKSHHNFSNCNHYRSPDALDLQSPEALHETLKLKL